MVLGSLAKQPIAHFLRYSLVLSKCVDTFKLLSLTVKRFKLGSTHKHCKSCSTALLLKQMKRNELP